CRIRRFEVQSVFAVPSRSISKVEDDAVAQREAVDAVTEETVIAGVVDRDEIERDRGYVRERNAVGTGALNRAAGAGWTSRGTDTAVPCDRESPAAGGVENDSARRAA